ncbi:MAG: DNA-processing protein DprA [Candidatus Stygibacter frigidus]|nr:DNA-processing protein DprA [Candidatus Stygibacter frigidus]
MDENKLTCIILNTSKPEGSLRLTNRQNYFLSNALHKSGLQYIDLYDPQNIAQLEFDKIRDVNSLKDRIKNLLTDRADIAWKLENWQQSGISIITHLDDQYPQRLSETLDDKAPSVIYALGKIDNLKTGGIAVLGSRDIDEQIKMESQKIARTIIENGYSVISGGAKGVDLIAMQTALDYGGKAIGFLKQNFSFKNLSKSGWNKFLEDGSLTLLTEIAPDEKMDRKKYIAAAMSRNKYIYALAEFGIVVASDNKGGTWEGAQEQIKKFKKNLFVLNKDLNSKKGNKELIDEFHALELPDLNDQFIPNLKKKYNDWVENSLKYNKKNEQLEIAFT